MCVCHWFVRLFLFRWLFGVVNISFSKQKSKTTKTTTIRKQIIKAILYAALPIDMSCCVQCCTFFYFIHISQCIIIKISSFSYPLLHYISFFPSSVSLTRTALPSIAFQFYMPLFISPTIPSMKWLKRVLQMFQTKEKHQQQNTSYCRKKAIKFIFPTPHLVDFYSQWASKKNETILNFQIWFYFSFYFFLRFVVIAIVRYHIRHTTVA